MKNKIVRKILAATAVSGLVLSNTACQGYFTPPDTTTEEKLNCADYRLFSTNNKENPNSVSREYFEEAWDKKQRGVYDPIRSQFKDEDYEEKPLIIQVPLNFGEGQYSALVDVVNYYNEIFELANMSTRFEIEVVNTIDNTADISILMSSNFEENIAGRALLNPDYDTRSKIATIEINYKMHGGNMATSGYGYNTFRHVLTHELGHTIGIDHDNIYDYTLMTPNATRDTRECWQFTHVDLKCFMSQFANIFENEELMQNAYNYIEQKAIEFYTSICSHANWSQDLTLNNNSVAYYYFDLSSKEGYDNVIVNLNNIYKGEYEATLTLTNGKQTTFKGRAYIISDTNSDSPNAPGTQTIWLDQFKTRYDYYYTAGIYFNSDKLSIDIGPSPYGIFRAPGAAYSTELERDATITQNDDLNVLPPSVQKYFYLSKKDLEKDDDLSI